MGVNLSDVAPGGRNHDPDRRCIQRFQVYRLSAQTDPLLVWRLTRCDAPGGSTHAQYAGVENVSRSFHAHREPQQFTHFGSHHNTSFSRSKDETCLMRLPIRYGWCARTTRCYVARLTPMGGLPAEFTPARSLLNFSGRHPCSGFQ